MRIPKALVKELDAWCVGTGMSRSEAIRHMIEDGLKKKPPRS
jgi:metal-responsive CopG/Arc/MetJ family transcriptional regulator